VCGACLQLYHIQLPRAYPDGALQASSFKVYPTLARVGRPLLNTDGFVVNEVPQLLHVTPSDSAYHQDQAMIEADALLYNCSHFVLNS
jgi:hypothetical protein